MSYLEKWKQEAEDELKKKSKRRGGRFWILSIASIPFFILAGVLFSLTVDSRPDAIIDATGVAVICGALGALVGGPLSVIFALISSAREEKYRDLAWAMILFSVAVFFVFCLMS